jgi:hypothetical protein
MVILGSGRFKMAQNAPGIILISRQIYGFQSRIIVIAPVVTQCLENKFASHGDNCFHDGNQA